jgi:ribosomal-protein-alanine N-acetyltransferase
MSAVIKSNNSIRIMRYDDLDEIMEIEEQAYDFPWSRGIFTDCLRVGYTCLVHESVDEIHAYAVMSTGAGESHILNVCVREDMQGLGLGRQLVEHLVKIAKNMKSDVILLEVRPSNRPALALYHELGFNEVGIRKAYYPTSEGREDALILAMSL